MLMLPISVVTASGRTCLCGAALLSKPGIHEYFRLGLSVTRQTERCSGDIDLDLSSGQIVAC